ncbi:hypothetical protein Tco_1075681 [Tanacetum coccineum]
MRKFNFNKAVAYKFKEYDQKLEALTNFNVSEAFEKAVQEKVLTEIKKLLPTHIPNAIANYVKPHLNTSALEVMKTNQINLFIQSSTCTDDLLEMEEFTRTSQMRLIPHISNFMIPFMNLLFSIKMHSMVKLRNHPFTKDIHKDENHIFGPSTVVIAKKFNELIQKDELSIADLEGAGLERLKVEYNNDVELKYHVSHLKAVVLSEAQWNTHNRSTLLLSLKHYAARYYKEGIEDRIPERWSKEVRCYHFEALNGIHHWEENRIDFFKARMRAVTEGNIFLDLRIKSVVSIDVKKKQGYGFLSSIIVSRSDDKEYEFSYADLPRLSVNDVKDIRAMIKNRVEDIQLGVESYQRSLNLAKPIMFFKGIDQRIPFTMSATHKGVKLRHQRRHSKRFLKGERTCDDYDVRSSREMLKKIDEILRHRRAAQEA